MYNIEASTFKSSQTSKTLLSSIADSTARYLSILFPHIFLDYSAALVHLPTVPSVDPLCCSVLMFDFIGQRA